MPPRRIETGVRGAMRHERKTRRERQVGWLADEQWGVVVARQLRALRVSRDTVKRWVGRGRLVPMWSEAYSVGHRPLVIEGWISAGVLIAEGPAAARSAAHLWGWRELGETDPIEAWTAGEPRNRQARFPSVPALKISHCDELPERTRRRGIPVTTADRTVVDCCAVLPYRRARRLVGEALVQKHVTTQSLVAELERNAGRRGAGVLRRIVATAQPTRSEAEELLVTLLHDYAIDGLETNVFVPGVGELDAYAEAHALAIEVDSRQFHDNAIARADDAAKDRRARAQGIRVIRLRWRALTVDRPKTAARLRDALDRAGPRARALCAAGGC